MDKFFIRRAIFNALTISTKKFKGAFLDAGCGKMPYKQFILENSEIESYVGLDIENALTYDQEIQPDFTWDGMTMPFDDDSFDTVMATEVLEHCPEPLIYLKEVRRVLKPDGVFFFTVPFIWNLHEVPHDEYRYTPFSLSRLLRKSGFSKIEIKASGGWHASMAQMMGLWLIRSKMNINLRRGLKILLFPIYKLLLHFDNPPEEYSEKTIAPSWFGVIQ